MATYGRDAEIKLFLNSLLQQTYKDFELIIVDQNKDDRAYNVYSQYFDKLNIRFIRSDRIGISYNRNSGLELANGNIISFPDDDCEYDTNTLRDVYSFFINKIDFGFYTCNTIDKNYREKSVFVGQKKDGPITRHNLRRTGISFTLFVKASSLIDFKFDDDFGVGSEYGSAEESDLILYLLKHDNKGYYFSHLYIYHPHKLNSEIEVRFFNYGKGLGAFYKKALVHYRYPSLLFDFLFILIKNIIAIIILSARKARIASLKGRLYGFIKYKPS
jgi:glycosyltransferase involved in cell wall biosynthesis